MITCLITPEMSRIEICKSANTMYTDFIEILISEDPFQLDKIEQILSKQAEKMGICRSLFQLKRYLNP